MGVKNKTMAEYAVRYDRHDLDRLGLFVEMPYMLEDPKKKKKPKKNKKKPLEVYDSMLAGYPKSKCGNQDGYFEEEFKRVFGGEYKKKPKKKPPKSKQVPFIPSGPGKRHATPGDYFGCFNQDDEWPERFSPAVIGELRGIRKKKTTFSKPNAITGPGKKGGCGYVDICLNEYPEHADDPPPKQKKKNDMPKPDGKPPIYGGFYPHDFNANPYIDPKHDPPRKLIYVPPDKVIDTKQILKPPFSPAGPGKESGGCHGGGFSRWPDHKKEPYLSPYQIERYVKPPKKGVVLKIEAWMMKDAFQPPSTGYKTLRTRAVLMNTSYTLNERNWKTYETNYTKYL